MNGKRRMFLLVPASILVVFASLMGIWHSSKRYRQYQVESYYQTIKDNPKVYCYDDFSGALNPALYVDDIKHRKSLVTFYDCKSMGIDTSFNFPIKFMPYRETLILARFVDSDSSLAEVVSVNASCWGMIKGYVSAKTLHHVAPAPALLKKDSLYWVEKEKDADYKVTSGNIGKKNGYGFQCD